MPAFPRRRTPTDAARTAITGARFWLLGSNAWRYPRLWFNQALGQVLHFRGRGWWSMLWMGLAAAGILILFPLVLRGIVALVDIVGIPGLEPAPTVAKYLSLTNVAIVFALALVARWIARARERVLVEGFVDFTKEEEKAVGGLSTLLVTELGRLRELYQQVTELSLPTAVGVERQGGFNRGKEPASFLTVSADDVTNVLEGAVASDATVEIGPAKVPLRPILVFLNRITRGPRVVGSVHLTEASGGPTLTAQLVGGRVGGTWRVDRKEEPGSKEEQKAFLDTMVRELACRMYTQVTLKGSVRWKAIEAFNDYLQLYGDSHRTPRDRARFLKRAQSRLLSAVAEDERFDLAYYNLGVIYTQLAQAELNAERQSQDATSRANLERGALDSARREAARVAFLRAAERNPDRWEAYYALAVTRFSQIYPIEPGAPPDPARDDRRALRDVIAFCDQALRVVQRQRGSKAAIQDLRGMALARLDQFDEAMRCHKRAVRQAWNLYCKAERVARARPTGDQHLAERARANATASMSNLALAYERRALVEGSAQQRRRDLAAAERVFKWAIRLAGEGSDLAAPCHFERGIVLERQRRYGDAAEQFQKAHQIHPRNSEYAARHARALAYALGRREGLSKDERKAEAARVRSEADRALELLGRPFSVAVSPFPPPGVKFRVENTLLAIDDTWAKLGRTRTDGRSTTIRELRTLLDKCCKADATTADELVRELDALRDDYLARKDDLHWEIEQLLLGKARLLARLRRWDEAQEALAELKPLLEQSAASFHLVEFGFYAYYAQALRECGNHRDALGAAAECVRRDPLNVEGRREAGRAHFALGQYHDALASWDQALWLSPGDPYLHYEVAMCRRRLAAVGGPRSKSQMKAAAAHFLQARELFDGEDLDGEAWTRFWLGRTALERGDPRQAIEHLHGARHGSTEAAAALMLGEAYLQIGDRTSAEREFELGEVARRERRVARLPGRNTIDSGWGDELPEALVRARFMRGLLEARYLGGQPLTPHDWREAERLLDQGRRYLHRVEPSEHARTWAMFLQTEQHMHEERERRGEAPVDDDSRYPFVERPDPNRFRTFLDGWVSTRSSPIREGGRWPGRGSRQARLFRPD